VVRFRYSRAFVIAAVLGMLFNPVAAYLCACGNGFAEFLEVSQMDGQGCCGHNGDEPLTDPCPSDDCPCEMRSTAVPIEMSLPAAGHYAEALCARTHGLLVATLPWDGALRKPVPALRPAVINDARSLKCVMII
jgi:hypothetical protein